MTSSKDRDLGLIAPHLSPDGLIVNPVRPIWETRFAGRSMSSKSYVRRNSWKVLLCKFLQTHLFISNADVKILLRRRLSSIKKIFNNIESLFDNLALFEREIFNHRDKVRRCTLKTLIRKSIRVSMFSIGDFVSQWKDFTNWFVTRTSHSEVREHISLKGNMFKFLLNTGLFKELLNRRVTKDDALSIAHLISTRNFANGEEREQLRSIQTFRKTVTSEFTPNDTILEKARKASFRIGKICSTIGGNRLRGGHVSLNTAGEYNFPSSKGGKSAAAHSDLSKFLNEIPEESETRDYPFGTVFYPKGRTRWQAFGRTWAPPDARFLAPMAGDPLPEDFVEMLCCYDASRHRLYGADENTGKMLYVTAWEMYKVHSLSPIPIRQATVSEPGMKSRIVTTGPWWLTVIQQPAVHELKELVSYHPSAHSCLMRCDQAWQSLYVWKNLGIESLGDKYAVLSSDLKEATDAVPHIVAKVLIEEFCKGVGNTKWSYITDLIGERLVHPELGQTSFILKRGVMMGEPLSKLALVLLGLVVEEIAYSEYVGRPLGDIQTQKDLQWRAYHLGGDDHVAIGPRAYLNMITSNHKMLGSLISPTKHRISNRYVVYTEKVLYVDPMESIIINRNPYDVDKYYSKSVFVDSVKVRLLSPFSRTIEKHNDRNVAIGKAIGLCKTIAYAKDPLTKSHMRTAYDRFLYRFRGELPSRHRRKLFSFMGLPVKLGGLGLSLDLEKVLPNMASIINQAIRIVANGAIQHAFAVRTYLTHTMKNTVPRGMDNNEYALHQMELFSKNPAVTDGLSLEQIREKFDSENQLSFRRLVKVARDAGYRALSQIPMDFEKQHLMKRLLVNTEKPKRFNTVPIRKRFQKLWGDIETYIKEKRIEVDDSCLTLDIVQKAAMRSGYEIFVPLGAEITAAIVDTGNAAYTVDNPYAAYKPVNLTWEQTMTFGLPNLKFGGLNETDEHSSSHPIAGNSAVHLLL